MTREQTCCVTGHRDIPTEKRDLIKALLRREVLKAISEGYTHFISGFAAGVDLIFAEIVAELKREYSITLEAAIPYPGRMKTPDKTFQSLIKNCDVIRVHADHYHKGCYMNRNRYMVDNSTMVIAVSDGREYGGTVATMRYANVAGCVIKEIHL